MALHSAFSEPHYDEPGFNVSVFLVIVGATCLLRSVLILLVSSEAIARLFASLSFQQSLETERNLPCWGKLSRRNRFKNGFFLCYLITLDEVIHNIGN